MSVTSNEAKQSRKKLIEVSIPLEAINAETKRRKQKAPKGYPTSFHKYWAQRPVAACRAVIFAQLVDDPSACPEDFPTKASEDAERDRLHRLMERLISWEVSTNETILGEARYEIARSIARGRGEKLPPFPQMRPQQIIDYIQAHAPPIYDPFSGAGSIPIEAQRLGLKTIGTDLNPLAVLIGKALVEFPPKFVGRKPVNPEINDLILRFYRALQIMEKLFTAIWELIKVIFPILMTLVPPILGFVVAIVIFPWFGFPQFGIDSIALLILSALLLLLLIFSYLATEDEGSADSKVMRSQEQLIYITSLNEYSTGIKVFGLGVAIAIFIVLLYLRPGLFVGVVLFLLEFGIVLLLPMFYTLSRHEDGPDAVSSAPTDAKRGPWSS